MFAKNLFWLLIEVTGFSYIISWVLPYMLTLIKIFLIKDQISIQIEQPLGFSLALMFVIISCNWILLKMIGDISKALRHIIVLFRTIIDSVQENKTN